MKKRDVIFLSTANGLMKSFAHALGFCKLIGLKRKVSITWHMTICLTLALARVIFIMILKLLDTSELLREQRVFLHPMSF